MAAKNKSSGRKMDEKPADELHHKRKKYLGWAVSIFLILGILSFLLWWFYFRIEDHTDDAYVHGNMLELTSQVSAMVRSVNTDNTFYVQKDQVIVELDPTDYELALRKSMAELGQTVRHVVTLFDDVVEKQAEVERARSELVKAEQDYAHRVGVVDLGAVSVEDFEHAEAELKSARADLEMRQANLSSAIAMTQNTSPTTHPLVISAQEKVKEAYVNLMRCQIVAPVDGVIDQRRVQVGEYVNTTDPLLALIPMEQMWVEANFKETHLKRIRIGQPVKMHADIYGDDVTFHGRVIGLSAGTGAAFSVLPPQNATGNWIKIVQRLPVRIALDPDELRRNPLRIGFSMSVKVDTKEEVGRVIPEPSIPRAIYYTDVYQQQEEGVSALIDRKSACRERVCLYV